MRRKNSYLLVGIAIALIAYLVVTRPVEGLETTVKIADEHGAGKVPDGAKKVKYGAGERWAYTDVNPGDLVFCSNMFFGDPAPGVGKACYAIVNTPDPPPTETAGAMMGIMPSTPCKVSELSDGIWGHKGVTSIPERFEPTTKESVDSAKDCAAKCCQNKECNAFAFIKSERVCWLYNSDPKKLESVTTIHDAKNSAKGSVDKSGGMNDLTNALSGGATQTMESIYGVLGSGLSGVAIVGIVLAVLAIGIPIAVYAYKYLGGGALSSSSLPIVNPVTRIKIPVAK
jgi:hypothetical protein